MEEKQARSHCQKGTSYYCSLAESCGSIQAVVPVLLPGSFDGKQKAGNGFGIELYVFVSKLREKLRTVTCVVSSFTLPCVIFYPS